MTLVKFPSGEVIDMPDDLALRIIDAQTAGLVMERDLEQIRRATAQAIKDQTVKTYRFEIGDDLHPYARTVQGKHCPVCEGLFPLRGTAYAIQGPFDDQWRPVHFQCFALPGDWL